MNDNSNLIITMSGGVNEILKGTIIYLGGFELPDKNAAAHRVVANGKILEELGYKVVYVELNKSKDRNKAKMLKLVSETSTVVSIPYPESKLEWAKYLMSINTIKKIIKNNEKVKAVIAYNYPSNLLNKLIQFCKKNNIKIISDVTEWYEDSRIFKKIDTTLRMSILNKRVDGLICISSYLRKYYMEDTQTILLPPLLDLQDYKWEKGKEHNRGDRINLIYSGNPGKHKDKLNVIIKELLALQTTKSIKFRILGISREQYLCFYPEHIELLSKANANIKIEFMGRLPHQETLEYIKKADFQIFLREDKRVNNAGFPTKFGESMACGTPVITTNTSDLNDYLIEGKNGYFVNYYDGNSLTKTLNRVIGLEKDEIISMKSYCLKITDFDFRKYIKDFNVFLESIDI